LKLDAEARDLETELQAAQQQAQDDASKVATAAASMQSLVIPSSDTIALWRSGAAEPLKKELSGMMAELEQLQRRYAQGWDEREKDWASRVARSEEAVRESGLKVEMRLQQEASSLRVQLEEKAQQARDATQAAEQNASALQERLRESLSEVSDARNGCHLLQSECNIALEDEQHARSMFDQAEVHYAELEQSRRRDRERADHLELQVRRQRERELAELRRSEASEAVRMRSFLQQTLSTISAAATFDESPSKESASSGWPSGSRGRDGLAASADAIAERASPRRQ